MPLKPYNKENNPLISQKLLTKERKSGIIVIVSITDSDIMGECVLCSVAKCSVQVTTKHFLVRILEVII